VDYESVHQTILFTDIREFGRPGRIDMVRAVLRARLGLDLRESLRAATVDPERCVFRDRGDGFLVLIPGEVPKKHLLNHFVIEMEARIRQHNAASSEQAQIQLRMAMHAGEVAYDEHGEVGTDVNIAARLLDCAPLRDALSPPRHLALIVSDPLYRGVVRQDAGLIDASDYRRVKVHVKEFEAVGWITVFPRRTPDIRDHAVSEPPATSPPQQGATISFHGKTSFRDLIAGDSVINKSGSGERPSDERGGRP
jgi:class 3 adenylate cyclase